MKNKINQSYSRTLKEISEEGFHKRVIRRINKISNSKRLIEESKKFSTMVLIGLAADFRKINNSSLLQEKKGGGKKIDFTNTLAVLDKITDEKIRGPLSQELQTTLSKNGVTLPAGSFKTGASPVVKAQIKTKDEVETAPEGKTTSDADKEAKKEKKVEPPAPGSPGAAFKPVQAKDGSPPAPANIAGPFKPVVPRSGGNAVNTDPEGNEFSAYRPSNLPANTTKPDNTDVADSLADIQSMERERVAAASAPAPAPAGGVAPAPAGDGVTKVNQKITALPAAAAAVPPKPRSMGQDIIPRRNIAESLKRKYRLGLITLREYNIKKQQLDNLILKEEIKRQVKSLLKK